MGMVGRGFSLLLLVAVATLQVSFAAVYKVGDSSGWTTIGNVDYKKWASTKTFHVGDIIRHALVFDAFGLLFWTALLGSQPGFRISTENGTTQSRRIGNGRYWTDTRVKIGEENKK